MPKKQGRYAVIGPTTQTRDRTFMDDKNDIIRHAGNLMQRQGSNTDELLIVEVIGVVRRVAPVEFFPVEYKEID